MNNTSGGVKIRAWHLLLLLVFVVAVAGFTIHRIYVNTANFWAGVERFEGELEGYGVEIQEGVVKSPAVIITVESERDFFLKVQEAQGSIVYREKGGFFVKYYLFTEDYNLAYKYTLSRGL
ncbi:MAG: hypothetical protein HWN68_08300 [Desulfobacterales bacterium]|nr:hypothetical protein [Desulfobacterales bacterium]